MPPRKQNRTLAILLAVVAAAALAVGALGPRWLTRADSNEEGFGLRTVELCEDKCLVISNSELVDIINLERERIAEENKSLAPQAQREIPKKPWNGFPVVGWIALVSCLLAAAGLLVGALVAISNKRPHWPIMPTTLSVLGLLIGLVNGCIFVATKPSNHALDYMGVGWSFFVFGAGVVTGLAAVFPLNKAIRPIDDDLGEASATMSWGTSSSDNL
jgi:hypothetical protein